MRRREHPDKTFYRGNVELSDFVGCSNIEFLGYFSCLDEMEGPGVRRFCDYRLAKKWDKVATSQNPQDAGGR